ncbi:hypothetical protein K461DRAFT_97047 [Myriangium duriaei CBS 260.36]|uniref:Zn(2)-C6 fungal-type domain-containing protein n=1 Tax=Myriangium duriaei CBS 260.36 TaxID=1168546 RepID=A0A9P4JCU7_9PEZI|nr:hypothetical protein K461DRAFT_97047 [Myriangium duriaei CBS 260.36]
MPSTSRPYVRKTKGCYPCSRRRIHCDRTEPSCNKCVARGLQCTGLGLRIKFSYGESDAKASASGILPNALEKEQKGNGASFFNHTTQPEPSMTLVVDPTPSSASSIPPWKSSPLVVAADSHRLLAAEHGHHEDGNDGLVGHSSLAVIGSTAFVTSMRATPTIRLTPENIPRWKLMMCRHFSDNIAPEMAAIDGVRNGWRSLVLPFAHTNDLVMGAVVTVSLHHVWRNWHRPNVGDEMSDIKPQLRDPNEFYIRVIHKLQELPELTKCDLETRNSVLLTILVLFVGVMVTGRSDFRILSRMLESALEAVGGEDILGDGDAARFIKTQIHKFRLYSAPLLNEQKGMQVISSRLNTDQLLDCLTYNLSDNPQHSLTVLFVKNMVQQAVDIYLDQVRSESMGALRTDVDEMASIIRVQQFIDTMETFPERTSCEQVLIWACFVAASGSVLPEHRESFERILQRQYVRSGFDNIRKGIERLQSIWHRPPNQRWTSLLAQSDILLM